MGRTGSQIIREQFEREMLNNPFGVFEHFSKKERAMSENENKSDSKVEEATLPERVTYHVHPGIDRIAKVHGAGERLGCLNLEVPTQEDDVKYFCKEERQAGVAIRNNVPLNNAVGGYSAIIEVVEDAGLAGMTDGPESGTTVGEEKTTEVSEADSEAGSNKYPNE